MPFVRAKADNLYIRFFKYNTGDYTVLHIHEERPPPFIGRSILFYVITLDFRSK